MPGNRGALRKDDYITSTRQGHGDVIANGCDVREMFAELHGRTRDCCGGKGGWIRLV